MVEYFDSSLGYIPKLQIYCHEANLPALLSNYQQAIVALLSNYQQVTVPKGAIVARTGLRSDIHLRERPRNNIRPCHCVGVLTDPAIVWVYQSIKLNHCAGIFKQYNPAYLQGIHNNCTTETRQVYAKFCTNTGMGINIEVYRSRIGHTPESYFSFAFICVCNNLLLFFIDQLQSRNLSL